MTVERLTELLAAATPGPWEWFEGPPAPGPFPGDSGIRQANEPKEWVATADAVGAAGAGWINIEDVDAALIVALRNAAPELLAVVAAAREFIADVDDALSDSPNGHDAFVRIGARFQSSHDATLRKALHALDGEEASE